MKKLIDKYYKPTPKLWRKIGDSLLASSVTITTYAICNDYKGIAITALIMGTVGKFISNFFTEETPN